MMLALCLVIVLLVHSFTGGIIGGTVGGTVIGMVMAFLYLIGGAFAYGVPIASLWIFIICTLLGFAVASGTDFKSMYIWGWISILLAIMAYFAHKEKKNKQQMDLAFLDAIYQQRRGNTSWAVANDIPVITAQKAQSLSRTYSKSSTAYIPTGNYGYGTGIYEILTNMSAGKKSALAVGFVGLVAIAVAQIIKSSYDESDIVVSGSSTQRLNESGILNSALQKNTPKKITKAPISFEAVVQRMRTNTEAIKLLKNSGKVIGSERGLLNPMDGAYLSAEEKVILDQENSDRIEYFTFLAKYSNSLYLNNDSAMLGKATVSYEQIAQYFSAKWKEWPPNQ